MSLQHEGVTEAMLHTRQRRTLSTALLSLVMLLPMLVIAQPAQAAVRTGADTILLIHGFNGGPPASSLGHNCNGGYFGDTIAYLNRAHPIAGQSRTWIRKDFRTLKFYSGDTNCTDDLHDPRYQSRCANYVKGGEGSNNESLYHLSCLLAWYLHLNYDRPGWNVEIVAHSMGGLIVRNTIYQVVNHKAAVMPPSIPRISDVVTFATPHGGIGALQGIFNSCPVYSCTQVRDMKPGGQFMNEMETQAQLPQAPGFTDWTMMSSECDAVVGAKTGLQMNFGRKSVFRSLGNFCYDHGGYLHDPPRTPADVSDADIFWCDGTGVDLRSCNRPPAEGWGNWRPKFDAPRSLHHMMHSLWLSDW